MWPWFQSQQGIKQSVVVSTCYSGTHGVEERSVQGHPCLHTSLKLVWDTEYSVSKKEVYHSAVSGEQHNLHFRV